VTVSVAVSRIGGFEEPVSIGLLGPPAGISAATVTTAGTFATLELTASRGVALGRYLVVLRSVSGDIERTTVVWVSVRRAQPQTSFASIELAHVEQSGR